MAIRSLAALVALLIAAPAFAQWGSNWPASKTEFTDGQTLQWKYDNGQLGGGGDMNCSTTPGSCVLKNPQTDNLCIGDQQGQNTGECAILLNASGLAAFNVPGQAFSTRAPLTGPLGEYWDFEESQDQPGNERVRLLVTGDLTSNLDVDVRSLGPTGVTPASYTSANITINAEGKITSASNGTESTESTWSLIDGNCPIQTPANGQFLFDVPTWPYAGAATLCLSRTDSAGADQTSILDSLSAGGAVFISEGTTTLLATITADAVVANGYMTIPIAIQSVTGTGFTGNGAGTQQVLVQFGSGTVGYRAATALNASYGRFPSFGGWAGQSMIRGPVQVPAQTVYDVEAFGVIGLIDASTNTPGTFGFQMRAYTTDVGNDSVYQYANVTADALDCTVEITANTSDEFHPFSCKRSGLVVGTASAAASDPVWVWMELTMRAGSGNFYLPGFNQGVAPGVHDASGTAPGSKNFVRPTFRLMVHQK